MDPLSGSAIACITVVLVAATDFQITRPSATPVWHSSLGSITGRFRFPYPSQSVGNFTSSALKRVDVLSLRDSSRRHRTGSRFAGFGSVAAVAGIVAEVVTDGRLRSVTRLRALISAESARSELVNYLQLQSP